MRSFDFEEAFDVVVGTEGGYVNDPQDPGGETNWGISKRAYPKLDIKNLSKNEAEAIYLRDYWLKCRCADLPGFWRLPVFDCAVNQGCGDAIEFLQRAVGVADDGIFGPKTLAAVDRAGIQAFDDFQVYRVLDYARLSTFGRYGKGWLRRVMLTFRKPLEG